MSRLLARTLGVVLAALAVAAPVAAPAAPPAAPAAPVVHVVLVLPPRPSDAGVRAPWLGGALRALVETDLGYLTAAHYVRYQRIAGATRKTPAQLAALDRAASLALGRQLAARWVVTGSYWLQGARVHLMLEVLDAASGRSVASAAADEPTARVTDLASRLLLQVAGTIGLPVAPHERAGVTRTKTRSLDALQAYGAGDETLARFLVEGDRRRLVEALPHFERATRLDPRLAEAWSAYGWTLHAAKRPGAVDAFSRALALRPGLLDAQLGHGASLGAAGRHAEAVAATRAAIALNPFDPDSRDQLASTFLDRLDLANALVAGEEMLRVREAVFGRDDAANAPIVLALAQVANRAGQPARAAAHLGRALPLLERGRDPGRLAQALELAAELRTRARDFAGAAALHRRALVAAEQAWGADDPRFADALENLAASLWRQRQYAAAEPLLERALGIRRRRLGPQSAAVGMTIKELGLLAEERGDLQRAVKLFRESLAIVERTRGPDHLDVVEVLRSLAGLLERLGRLPEAQAAWERCLAIRERRLGADHPLVASILNNLAIVAHGRGDLERALVLQRRVIAILERRRGADELDVASALAVLGGLLKEQAAYGEAAAALARARAIRERRLGPRDPLVASVLQTEAQIERSLGRPDRARALLERSLKILEQAYGPWRQEVAHVVADLARTHAGLGELARAAALFDRSLAIYEKLFRGEHPLITGLLGEIADLYQRMGQHVRALDFASRCLRLTLRQEGPDHPNTGVAMARLGRLNERAGLFARAEPFYRHALRVTEKRFGPEHPQTAEALGLVAGVVGAQGQAARAEELFRRRIAIIEQRLGPEHPNLAAALSDLGGFLVTSGRARDGAPLLTRAVAIADRALGADHPERIGPLLGLGLAEAALGRPREAAAAFRRSLDVLAVHADRVFDAAASEAEKREFLGELLPVVDAAGNLALAYGRTEPETARVALDAQLRFKGAVLEALATQRRDLAAGASPAARRTWQELTDVRRQHATLALAGPGRLPLARHRAALDELAGRRRRLEAALAGQLPRFAERRRARRADSHALAAAVPPGAVVVELLRPRVLDFATGKVRAARYVGLAVRPGAAPAVVDLGAADQLDAAVRSLRRALAEPGVPRGGAPDFAAPASALHRQLIAPLALRPGERLIVSPDGELSLLPFDVLVDARGRFLVEEHAVSYLAAARDLLAWRPQPWRLRAGVAVTVVGDPDYGDTARAGRPVFGRLEATRAEAQIVARLLGRAALLLDAEASEPRLRAQRHPLVLHLATHGLFESDAQRRPAAAGTRGAVGAAGPPAALPAMSPMLRAAVALAGANRGYVPGTPLAAADDGLLTAEEAAGLDLDGTELVVLSACETGLGDVHRGEGVYGLRRGFGEAGARALVMSLWKVPDEATRRLMTSFYERLRRGEGRGAALRGATLDRLRDARARAPQALPHPFSWGAFVLVGDPR